MLPFEFIVEGPPLSQQTRSPARLQAWRAMVRAAARARWLQGQAAVTGSLLLTVVYYHEQSAIRMDNDNLVKPIQDALIGLVYVDDRQITDTRVRKTSIDGVFRVRYMSPVLAEGFVRGVAFLHVRVEEAPNHAELLR
jgi:crossover junction endodeoxyribonuclease RusA